jgi:hypothetical protein
VFEFGLGMKGDDESGVVGVEGSMGSGDWKEWRIFE